MKMSKATNVTRYFHANIGTGFIRVEQRSTGWFWARKHGNGTESSSPKAYKYCSDAVDAAGGDSDAEFYPGDDTGALRMLDDAATATFTPETFRPSELVHRLRRLELNDMGAEVRLLRDLYLAVDDASLERLTPRSRARIEMLVDRQAIINALESLPINEKYNSTPVRETLYFVLSGGEWCPVASAEERKVGSILWLNAAINHPDGSSSSLSARWPEWAHATSDHKPSLRF